MLDRTRDVISAPRRVAFHPLPWDALPATVELAPARVRNVLFAAVAALVVLGCAAVIAVHVFGVNPKNGIVLTFNLDKEQNVPTYISGVLLLINAVLAGLIARVERLRGSGDARYWLGMACAFFYMSMDEVAVLHEHLVRPIKAAIDLPSYLHYAWVVPYAVIVVVFVAVYCRFWWRLPSGTRWRLAAAATVFLSGAVGMEMISGHFAEAWGTTQTLGYAMMTTVEESLELIAHVLFISTLLRHLGGIDSTLTFEVTPSNR